MSEETAIEETKTGWTETVVMVCSKCAKQFSDPSDAASAERIKGELKGLARESLGARVRVVTTSCLNICPVNQIAITKSTNKKSPYFSSFTVGPKVSVHDLFKKILKD